MKTTWLTVALGLLAAGAQAQTTTTRTDRLIASTQAIVGGTTLGANTLNVTGTLGVSSNATVGGTLGVTGLATLSDALNVQGGIYNSAGSLTISDATLLVQYDLTVNGNTTLGNATSDTVTLTGRLASGLTWGTDNTYDIGASGANRPRALYLAGGATISGAVSLGSTLGVSGVATFSNDIGSSLIPSATDTYDLGSAAKLWNQGWISTLNAVLFAETTATLFGGWSIIGHDAGSLAADVASAATTVDFGKTMTEDDWVVIRAHDASGTVKAEYLTVGSNVSGTVYNVTRDLASAHGTDPAWVSGTPFLVLGTTGDGRIELLAYTTPRISILTQGATYGTVTESVRIGYLDGMPGMAAGKVGLYIGDLTGTEGLSYYDGVLTVRGTLNADDLTAGTVTGRTVQTASSGSRIVLDSTPSLTWYGPIAGTGTFTLGSITASGLSIAAQYSNLLTASETGYKFDGPTTVSTDRFGVFGSYNDVSADYNKAVRVASRWTTADAANVTLESSIGSEIATVNTNVAGTSSSVNLTADTVNTTAATHAFGDDSTVILAIDGANNRVGVLTTSPAQTVDVRGNLRATTTITVIGTTATDGYLSMTAGTSANIGYLAFHAPTSGTRQGYLGWGSSNVNLYLENSAHFEVNGGAIQLPEMSEPSAPSANYGRLYVKDNGSGKSQLCVRFASGASQCFATEP